jgi:hypothetical protein
MARFLLRLWEGAASGVGRGWRYRSQRQGRSTVPSGLGELDTGLHARLENTQRWKRGERGRVAGRKGGKPSGGETSVNDPPTQPGVVGGTPASHRSQVHEGWSMSAHRFHSGIKNFSLLTYDGFSLEK